MDASAKTIDEAIYSVFLRVDAPRDRGRRLIRSLNETPYGSGLRTWAPVFVVDVLVCDAGGGTLRILDLWAHPQRERKLAVPRHKENQGAPRTGLPPYPAQQSSS